MKLYTQCAIITVRTERIFCDDELMTFNFRSSTLVHWTLCENGIRIMMQNRVWRFDFLHIMVIAISCDCDVYTEGIQRERI